MEKIRLLLYCTKNGKKLVDTSKYDFDFPNQKMSWQTLNGKIVAECDFEVEEHNETSIDWLCMSLREKINFGNMCEKANIDELECYKYANGKPLYAIHIKNLNIFDKPRELNFYHNAELDICLLKNAPQNMMYVYDYKGLDEYEKKVLISIRPEYLVKILNGEKTIEVRKRVLKEMVK